MKSSVPGKSAHVHHSDRARLVETSQNITAMTENAVMTKTGWEFIRHGENYLEC